MNFVSMSPWAGSGGKESTLLGLNSMGNSPVIHCSESFHTLFSPLNSTFGQVEFNHDCECSKEIVFV